ncbi:MAG: hypothetical protein WD646_00755 [Actinomycetota bacterium]
MARVEQSETRDVGEGGSGIADASDHITPKNAKVADHEVSRLTENASVDQADCPATESSDAGALLDVESAKDGIVFSLRRAPDEMNDLLGRILSIVVKSDDVVTGRVSKAAEIRVVLAVVLEEAERDDVLIGQCFGSDDVPTAIVTAVVYEDDLVSQTVRLEESHRSVNGCANQPLAIENGDNDAVENGR